MVSIADTNGGLWPAYSLEIEEVTILGLGARDIAMHSRWMAVLRDEAGDKVWSSNSYRIKRGAMLQGRLKRKELRQHFASTGERWEITQQRQAERRRIDRRRARLVRELLALDRADLDAVLAEVEQGRAA
jgi:hypothetical protein